MAFVRSILRAIWRRQRTPVTFSLAFVGALALVAVVAAQTDLATPSPAHGTAQVISQGMTARPDLRTGWRVVKRTIPLRSDARPSDRLEGSVGFLLADQGSIFVTDQDTKQRYRLAPGEAQFVPIGANQTWASLDPVPATAYTLELAIRENANVAGKDDVTFKSGSFGMAEGDYDLDLLRDTLGYNKKTSIDGTEFPELIFVTQGSIEVSSNKKGVKTVNLGEGDAIALEGDLTIRARSKSGATFVAALVSGSIGGGRTSIKPTATSTSTETPTEAPTATKTPNPKKTPPPTAEPTKKAKKSPTPTANQKPTKKEQTATATARKKKATPTPKAAEKPESRTGTAEVRIEVKRCPAGMDANTLNTSRCKDADGGWALALQTPFGDTLRSSQANNVNGHYIRWGNLKAGEYQLLVRQLPEGYGSTSLDGYVCCTAGGGYSIVLSKGLLVVGTIYLFPVNTASIDNPALLRADVGVAVADLFWDARRSRFEQ
jgi:hypothetical protein